MFNFGLPGYRPCWLRGRQELASHHGPRLRALAGRRLRRTWVVWDLQADAWFSDCPVVLDLDGEHLEVNHRNSDELSLTWNTIDLSCVPKWPAGEFRLAWRADALPRATVASGAVAESVALLDWDSDGLARGSVAVGLCFPAGWLTVYNACDENGLTFGPLGSASQPEPVVAQRTEAPPRAARRPGRRRTCTTSASAAWIHNRRPSSPT